MNENPNQHQRGSVNYIWVLGGGYLLYTAYELFLSLFKGEAVRPWLNILGGGLFVAVGAWMLWREWKAYQYGKAHKDDPESWTADGETPVESAEPEQLTEGEDTEERGE